MFPLLETNNTIPDTLYIGPEESRRTNLIRLYVISFSEEQLILTEYVTQQRWRGGL